MDILAVLTALVIGATLAWGLAQARAGAEMSRLRARHHAHIAYWQDEAERARAHAASLGEQAAAWSAGCQQGREDVVSIAHALVHHLARADDGPGAG